MLLKMKNIFKYFGPVQALKDVSLSVEKGEIHGLLGENGAGKSTLMNILAGTYAPTSGEMYFEDVKISDLNTKKTQNLGIRFIHQELNLVNDLTVYENLFLGEEIVGKFGLLNKREMIKRTEEILEKMQLDVDPKMEVRLLETSRKQLIEIAKALLFDAKLIIMDEPTTALTNKEIEMLFSLMTRLKENGVSMIYISHKMPELFAICDRYTVLRDGKFIESGYFRDINEKKATELLVGRSINNDKIHRENIFDETLMKVENISAEGKFSEISFDLKKGEVIAITGLHGDGRDYLAEALYGVCKINSGSVYVNNEKINYNNIKETIKNGISMVQRNRKERSIVKDMSILDNFCISKFVANHKKLFIDNKVELEKFDKSKKEMSTKIGHFSDLITSLSGGNQQKIIIGRCLELNTDVIIMDNPTQGIDVGAKFEIYKIINDLTKKGKGIIMFTSEYPEISKVADRCFVMYKGRINKKLEKSEFSEIAIMEYATGANMEVKYGQNS
ncbi:sugar ABC transporter ATP-binding protein [Fusobacterium sp. PH5-44]|uniref:sugar ABC transporter ATP-binding protein n=1 Tax=unclassified Fusobacterium TaxID=2648384 RepID=UPI003D25A92C